jgi:hypothetical protein
MAETLREQRGRTVRETWVTWAKHQRNPKPSWLTGWDDLDADQREVDMLIGEAVAEGERRRADVAEKRLAELENAVRWQTSCTSCAATLDASYLATVRAESAEENLAQIREAVFQGGEAVYVRRRLIAILEGASQGAVTAATRTIVAAERERIAKHLATLAGNYPEDVFPPDGNSRDAISGTAMRHAYRNAARSVREDLSQDDAS